MKIEKEGNYKLILNKVSFDNENNSLIQGVNNGFFIFVSRHFSDKPEKYILKEGDIIKLGRIWLIVRAINIPIRKEKEKEKEKRLERKDTDCIIVSHHNQGNQSLNITDDFNNDNKIY